LQTARSFCQKTIRTDVIFLTVLFFKNRIELIFCFLHIPSYRTWYLCRIIPVAAGFLGRHFVHATVPVQSGVNVRRCPHLLHC